MIRCKSIYKISGFIWLSFLLFTIACESEHRPEPIVPVVPDVVEFNQHIMPIFEGTSIGIDMTGKGKSCIQCHNGSTPPDLTVGNAYIELTAGGFIDVNDPENSKLYQKMEEGGSMNKYTNNVDVAYVLEWIRQGALEN